jgi:chromosome segregation ATPase
MERLQQQVATVEEQLDAAKEAATQVKAAEREVEGNLEDAKAQQQVSKGGCESSLTCLTGCTRLLQKYLLCAAL